MSAPRPTLPRLLHDFFETSARRYPDRIAIDIPPGPGRPHRRLVTYAELLAQADEWAGWLHDFTAPDGLVGIMLPRDSHRLYAAQLAVLKAGGAFTCIDPAFPDRHIQAILDDGEVEVLLTDLNGLARIDRSSLRVHHAVDVAAPPKSKRPRGSRPPSENSTPQNLAYVIYTSGTTGVPKGVMIEHHSIENLVASDLEEFQLTPDDRVAQSSSAAYDSSIEEIWLAFAAGATLVVMDDHTSRMGPDLIPWLRRERISVFCPPPTLLRTTGCTDPENALPDLRLLYVGGEALTSDLADRWSRGRRLVNGYGPTECTVTVVRGDVRPGHPVTIGRPVPGHTAWVVDAELNPVTDGGSGELCLSGPGLARGYRHRDDVTREKFPVHPRLGRIYRTGDLVRRNPDGDLEYLGRIDAQVKLRGYRVELEAIEAHLAHIPGVREAACRVQGEGGESLLVAHIVPEDANTPPAFTAVKEALRRTLPPYMVPARIGLIDVLPRSVGGKVDRKHLPDLEPDVSEPHRAVIPPVNAIEEAIVDAFASALRVSAPISTDDDFFLDLGGDSLSAVGVICTLREGKIAASVTTRDLYEARTPARLAARVATSPPKTSVSRPSRDAAAGHVARPLAVTLAQAGWLLMELLAVSAAAYAITLEFLPLLLEQFGIIGTLLLEIPIALAGMVVYTPLAIGITVAVKWALIGRYVPIRTPVWSVYYLRHWIVQSVARSIPWNILAGTVAYGAVLRLLGAKIGRRVHIHRGVNLQQGGWDLLNLGDDVTLSCDSHLGLVELDDGCLHIGPVAIQDGATLDIRAGVSAGTTIEAGGFLTALSWLPQGSRIRAGERWDGVPAAPDGLSPPAPTTHTHSSFHPAAYSALHLAVSFLARAGASLPILAILGTVSVTLGLSAGDVAAWLFDPSWSAGSFLIVSAASVLWVPVWLVIKALGVRCIGRVRPAVIPRWSPAYLRVWHKAAEVESAGTWLTGTLFWPIWLRLAGMDIGAKCEISSITDVVPENLSIGPESFFADGIYLGGPRIHRGTVTLCDTSLGRGTFLGNHVVIPAGAHLPDDLFIGVCTVADSSQSRPGSSWFGHPPLELPRRDVVQVDRRLTHEPGPLRYCTRLFWETLRFALPLPPLLVAGGWLGAMSLADTDRLVSMLLVAPAITLAALAAQCLAVVALKWALLGRARAGRHPLWSCWCSRWDFLYVAWQFYALVPLVTLEGTLFLCMYLRGMGSRIGRRVVLGPGFGQVADPDMITIEDDATVNANYQAHSFEDRVLKLAPVIVRRGATVGESAVLFYGADIGEDAWVTPNSVVMKSERLLPGLSYSGCPVQSLDGDACRRVDRAPAPPPAPSEGRNAVLDIARGLAVAGMIYMHFVPAEQAEGDSTSVWVLLSQFLEGKSAALFCVLAGMTWEIQARSAAAVRRGRGYFARRAFALAAVGVAFHIFAWPTEILVPFSLMMILSVTLRRMGRGAVLGAAATLLLLAPLIPAFFGGFVENDWNEDGSHLADATLGWATLRALVIDGNYPLIPWIAFPLLGMLIAQRWEVSRAKQIWFPSAAAVYLIAQAYVSWVDANAEVVGSLSAYLTSTWVPTSLPFMVVTGGYAIAVITGLAWWLGAARPGGVMALIALFGRASLTHYLLHICLLYLPLRAILGNEEWSVRVGVGAFAGYIALALPLTALWFHRFRRGPAEELWARASGR